MSSQRSPILNTWLLPDGVADLLPEDATALEMLRRQLTDVLINHGFELVQPPLIEYTESLLARAQEDLKRQTVKLIDQLNGRLMGVRADITHQVARIDAHVRPIKGVARYGYAAQVLHTVPQALFASRTPFQLGAEIFGHAGLAADIELIDLALELLHTAGLGKADAVNTSANNLDDCISEDSKKTIVALHIDLGNVAIFNTLAALSGIEINTKQALFDLYRRKALPELKAYCNEQGLSNDFYLLGSLSNDIDALMAQLSEQAKASDALMHAVLDLKRLKDHIDTTWQRVNVSIDAAELSSYHYHTGVVFSVYKTSSLSHERLSPNPVAQGGRYTSFGKTAQTHTERNARPATGFSCDLLRLIEAFKCANAKKMQSKRIIAAPALSDAALKTKVIELRAGGDVVINKLSDKDAQQATHQLHIVDGEWQLVELAK